MSGIFERYVDSDDERYYKVIRITESGREDVEDHLEKASPSSRTLRADAQSIDGPLTEEILVEENEGRFKLLGRAAKIFDKENVTVRYPTALGPQRYFSVDTVDGLSVIGGLDLKIDTAVYTFIWRAMKELGFRQIDPSLPGVTAYSFVPNRNRSFYDRSDRTLYYGGGKNPDGLDGFVVVHEWTHYLIDTLNPGWVGFDAGLLHEGLADFFAANLFNSSCFAPFDAQEQEGRNCLRQLENQNKIPDDLSGVDKHYSSLIISGALWEWKKVFPKALMNEVLLEAVIRSPKIPSVQDFWSLVGDIQKRLIAERPLISDTSATFSEIGVRRGLIEN